MTVLQYMFIIQQHMACDSEILVLRYKSSLLHFMISTQQHMAISTEILASDNLAAVYDKYTTVHGLQQENISTR